MRFPTDLARTPHGEPVLMLRDYATWDVIYERISQGMPIEEEIETVEYPGPLPGEVLCALRFRKR